METPKTIEISGISLPYSQGTEIVNYITNSEKLQAIKLFREATGLGLKEVKDAVELYIENTVYHDKY